METDATWLDAGEALGEDVQIALTELGITDLRPLSVGHRRPSYLFASEGAVFDFHREVGGDFITVGRAEWDVVDIPAEVSPFVFGLATMEELRSKSPPTPSILEAQRFGPTLQFLASNWGLRQIALATAGFSHHEASERQSAYWHWCRSNKRHSELR
ncbi:MAG: hypothetical protein ABL866_14255 [Devosia sp.]